MLAVEAAEEVEALAASAKIWLSATPFIPSASGAPESVLLRRSLNPMRDFFLPLRTPLELPTEFAEMRPPGTIAGGGAGGDAGEHKLDVPRYDGDVIEVAPI